MATSSITSTILPSFTISIPSAIPSKSRFSSLSLTPSVYNNALKFKAFNSSLSFTKVFAAPETLNPPPETLDGAETDSLEVGDFEIPGTSSLGIGADAEKMAPKQKIRIKLRSYWVPLIEDSCKQIMDAARNTNAKTMGPVPLPTKKRVYCVLKSPHVHKDARFHFEIRTHQRLIDILYPTAQTIDSLMQLDLPAGVDVEVKL
ncbi:Ribosomal_S10 domain-containing protein [Cephalotus follicularis]|uniref:Small ribosomal subunit protein uS10c n=1 Tax=Cephalotus follicularis TaxID=3775 RepID=A0A1Q3CX57_CEPFO|nr:Ribosomal_S10 domain-containing protein [Cephalotus follicularis]